MLREVLKLNSARRAFREDRFLDALEILEDPMIADHKKAQALREKVLAALKDRGAERREKGQLTLALTDMAEVAQRRPDDDARDDENQLKKMRVLRDDDLSRVRAVYFKARLQVDQGDLGTALLTLGVVSESSRTPEFSALLTEIEKRCESAQSSIHEVMQGKIDAAQMDAVLDDAQRQWARCPGLSEARRQVAAIRAERAVKSEITHGAFAAFLAEHGLYKARHLKGLDPAEAATLDRDLNRCARRRVEGLLSEGRDDLARQILARQQEHLSRTEEDESLRLGLDDLLAARHLLDRGDHTGARSRAKCAESRIGKLKSVRALLKAIDTGEKDSDRIMSASREALKIGELDKARRLLGELRDAYPNHMLARSLEEVIEEKIASRRVALAAVREDMQKKRYEAARKGLLQLRLHGHDSSEITELLDDVAVLERESLTLPQGESFPAGANAPQGALQGVADTWMLTFEGHGEFLVLEKDEISIGNSMGSQADLPLMAPIASKHAMLRRSSGFHDGVKYSVVAIDGQVVRVNGRQVSETQLVDGDEVTLGECCRLTFRLPATRSRAALIQLEDGLQIEGSRRIILLPPNGRAGAVLAGPAADGHLQVADAEGTLEVFREPGAPQLKVRSSIGVAVDGGESRAQDSLGAGSYFKAGSLAGAVRVVHA